jgi:hypothetical protein
MIYIEPGPDFAHFEAVCAFAASKGAQHSQWLWEALWQCHTYAEQRDEAPLWPKEYYDLVEGRVRFMLMRDSSPASFYFVVSRLADDDVTYVRWFNGGLIYHGDQSGWTMRDGTVIPPGYGVETFSVRLTSGRNENPWSMHT